MSQPTRMGAFIALLPGLQAKGKLMACVGAAIALARLSPALAAAGDDWKGLLTKMAKDGSINTSIDNLDVLAKALAELMADPAQAPLVMNFLRAFDTES